MPEISIIVPIYKVEKYLRKCVDSILAQTFTDFELILVDDGSPDDCGNICDEYAMQDARVVVIHKINGGLSDARNAGLEIAKGLYIGFVDSDDHIAPDMYAFLYRNLKEQHADISTCGIYDCYKDAVIVPRNHYSKLMLPAEALALAFQGKELSVNSVNKLFIRHLFEHLRFPLGKTSEDAYVICELFLSAQNVFIDNTPKYYYVHRIGSISTCTFAPYHLDVITAYQKNYDFIKDNCPQILDVAQYRLWFAYRYVLNRLAVSTKQTKKHYKSVVDQCTKVIRAEFILILKNRYNTINQKIFFGVICISPYLYMIIYSRLKENEIVVS